MRVLESVLGEVELLEPAVFEDSRGFFMEIWNARTFLALGVEGAFVQDNHSRSAIPRLPGNRSLAYWINRKPERQPGVLASTGGRPFATYLGK